MRVFQVPEERAFLARTGKPDAVTAARQLRLPVDERPVPVGIEHLKALAQEVVSRHAPGMPVPPIRVSKRMTRTLGSFTPAHGGITLSSRLLAFGTAEDHRWIMLHELAHAIVHHRTPKASAHGREFRAVCSEIGVEPSRLVDVGAGEWHARTRYAFTCSACGLVSLRKRRTPIVRCGCGVSSRPAKWTVIALAPDGGQRLLREQTVAVPKPRNSLRGWLRKRLGGR